MIAESGVTRADARVLARRSELADGTWPGFIDIDRFTPREPDFGRKPVLGRHSRHAVLKWPDDVTTISKVYASNDLYDVRVLGGVDSLPAKTRTVVEGSCEVLPFGAEPPEDFLAGLDFWAYFHSKKLTESFGMSIVEAMAAGVVVILPTYMRENFGSAAVYAEPHEVRGRSCGGVVERSRGVPGSERSGPGCGRGAVQRRGFSATPPGLRR